MRKALEGREDLGFQLTKRSSRRHPPVTITDLDFADDIALISEEIAEAQEMLNRVEMETLRIGLHLNEKKTKMMINDEYFRAYNFMKKRYDEKFCYCADC